MADISESLQLTVSIAPTLEAAPADPFRPRGRGDLRNVAIVAHVDHGKTTLVDAMLRASGAFGERAEPVDRIMDSGDLEREKGITILAKHTAIDWHGTTINVVDTPGHADFGGEVERGLSMVDGVAPARRRLRGPAPADPLRAAQDPRRGPARRAGREQDRPRGRPDRRGRRREPRAAPRAGRRARPRRGPHRPAARPAGRLRERPRRPRLRRPPRRRHAARLPGPAAAVRRPARHRAAAVRRPGRPAAGARHQPRRHARFLGRIALCRIRAGSIRRGQQVAWCRADGTVARVKITELLRTEALTRVPADSASAGDLVAVAGIADVTIGDTLADPDNPVALPRIAVDEPAISMTIGINTSPLVGPRPAPGHQAHRPSGPESARRRAGRQRQHPRAAHRAPRHLGGAGPR